MTITARPIPSAPIAANPLFKKFPPMKNIHLLPLPRIGVLLCAMLFAIELGFGQAVLNDCIGVAAAPNALANPAWKYTWGKWRDGPGQTNSIQTTNHGFNPNLFQVKTSGSIPVITQVNIPHVRPGGQGSYQLNTTSGGRDYAKMSTSFLVEPDNTMLLIHFAVVLQNPNHDSHQQPKFEVKVYNQANELIPCGTYTFVSGYNTPWPQQGDRAYLPWTFASIDLRAFEGEIMTIELATYDCTEGGHYGIALFDIECFKSQIFSSAFCPGKDTISLTAPQGFASYLWSNGATTRSAVFQNPQSGQVAWVKFRPFTNNSTSSDCELYMEYVIKENVSFALQDSFAHCEGGASVLSLTGPFGANVEWNNGATGMITPAMQTGIYRAMINYSGCTYTDSAYVEEVPVPNFELVPTSPTCVGGDDGIIAVSLKNASVSPIYAWNTSASLSQLSGLSSGAYTVTVTEGVLGCTASKSIGLMEPQETPLIITGSAAICEGKQTTLVGEGDFDTFLWSNGTQTAENTLSAPGTYTVTATDGAGCTVVRSVQVAEHPQPQPQITGSTYVCPGQTASLQTTAPFSEYEWSTGSLDASITVSAGNFTVTVTDVNGCIATASQAVEQKTAPPLSISAGDATLCGPNDSQPIIVDAPTGVSFSLNNGPGTSSNEFSVSGGGLYTVVVADAFGCTDTAEVQIRQAFDPQPAIVGDRDFCEGSETTLSGSTGFVAYEWSNGATSPQTTVGMTLALTLTVTDTLGCQWQTPVAQITEHLNPLAKITGEDRVCEHEKQLLIAEPPGMASYLWSNGETNPAQELTAGTHSVTMTDVWGCTGAATFTLGEIPLRTVSMEAVTPLVCDGAMAQIKVRVSNTDTTGTADFSETFGQTTQVAFAQGVAAWSFVPSATSTVRLDALHISGYDCPFLGLPAEVTVEVDKVQAQALPVLKTNDLPISCNRGTDGQITVQPLGAAPFSYQWNPAVSSSATAENLAAGVYAVTVTGAHGCTAIAEATLTEPAPFRPEAVGFAPLCYGRHDGIISMDNLTGGQGSVRAHINNALTLTAPGEVTGLPPSTYHVRLTDDLGCRFDTTIYFLEPPLYFVNILDTLIELELGDEYRILLETNIPDLVGKWSPTECIIDSSRADAILIRPIRDTRYTVSAVAPGNCPLPSASVLVRVKNTEPVFVPNIFSPNGDGKNDLFMVFVKSSAVRSIRSIAVTDQWGELVFQKQNLPPSNDLSQGWDGTFRGKRCPPDAYVWKAEIEFIDGEVALFSGDVTIVR